jgi:hypothetical protein
MNGEQNAAADRVASMVRLRNALLLLYLPYPHESARQLSFWTNTRERFSDIVMGFIRGEVWRSVGSSIIAVV